MRLLPKISGMLFIAALSLLLGACAKPEKTGTEALVIATDYLEAMKKGDQNTALTYLGGKASADEWLKELQGYQTAYGPLQEYKHRHTDEDTVLNGKYYIIEFNNTYAKTKVQETIYLFQEIHDKDIKITAIKHDVIGK